MKHALIRPEEREIFGGTVYTDTQAKITDETARIRWLRANHLIQVAVHPSGWSTLFSDPTDGRLWQLTFPHSGQHGGGPPMLSVLEAEEAKAEYGRSKIPDIGPSPT